ncbi:polysaccharide deacetylase family protein [Reyranella sp.]|jgi:peptidoglycan/xylan/chitin deacetylase (PgdA/CDA1 family)|uniref:polysaccharide deacetylase family protein n=1 Tax=Reyranella sp. TaxID=1929291 RepID=UPI002F93EF20
MTEEEAGRVRDFVGYGRNPPDPQWPGGAHVAVNFVINYEEGGEHAVPDGDGASETALTEGSTAAVKGRDLGAESMFQYGSRAGFWRLHRMFTKRALPCTVFAIARALARNPAACAAMREADWDVAGHGNRWEIHANLQPDDEREQIRLATEGIAQAIGIRPLGWYSRYAPSLHTRGMLLDAGYEYDSDAYDDELPYWVRVGHRRQLVVPYSLVHNDVRFIRQGMTSGDEYLAYVKNAVQCVLEEDPPRLLSFGLHNRIIAHPGRAMGLARTLDWLTDQPRVWVARRIDIARHWRRLHPAAG